MARAVLVAAAVNGSGRLCMARQKSSNAWRHTTPMAQQTRAMAAPISRQRPIHGESSTPPCKPSLQALSAAPSSDHASSGALTGCLDELRPERKPRMPPPD